MQDVCIKALHDSPFIPDEPPEEDVQVTAAVVAVTGSKCERFASTIGTHP